MKNKFLWVVLVVILAIAIGGYLYPQLSLPSGATPGADNYNLVNFQGGIRGKPAQFTSTTTIVCMIQNPTHATSTWSFNWKLNAATTTTTVLAIATSTNANHWATTTSIYSKLVSANAMGSVNYVPANGAGIVGPNDWVILGYDAGTTLGNVAQKQQGQCSAMFYPI